MIERNESRFSHRGCRGNVRGCCYPHSCWPLPASRTDSIPSILMVTRESSSRESRKSCGPRICAAGLPDFQSLRSNHSADQQALRRQRQFLAGISGQNRIGPDDSKYLQDYGYHLPALRDPEHELVKFSRVQVTPEAAVFDRNRQLVYNGRIDDWYRYPGGSRPAPTTHDLDDAVRAAIAGKSVDKSEVRGVGCYISDL